MNYGLGRGGRGHESVHHEFKIEAIQQIVEYGRLIAEAAERLGASIDSLFGQKRQQGKGELGRRVEQDQNAAAPQG